MLALHKVVVPLVLAQLLRSEGVDFAALVGGEALVFDLLVERSCVGRRLHGVRPFDRPFSKLRTGVAVVLVVLQLYVFRSFCRTRTLLITTIIFPRALLMKRR